MKGKLIVIEGSDGSGKATQSRILYDSLKSEGYPVRLLSFPDYESPSSALVKMYLAGEMGEDPEKLNIYAVSTFYAVDRYASFEKDWKDFYEKGGILLCDRYTTSNMVYQGVKLPNSFLKTRYYNWLKELEYEKFGLPKPDKVLFLDVHPEVSQRLRENRKNKITNDEALDIHEKNSDYMKRAYEAAVFAASDQGWETVVCTEDGDMKPIELIQEELYQKVKKVV